MPALVKSDPTLLVFRGQQLDEVAEQEGIKVFVAQELATPLEDAAIDVTKANGTPQLIFRPKGEDVSAQA